MNKKDKNTTNRRDFIKNLAIGGGVTIALGNLSFKFLDSENSERKVIICDYSKCTGCKTCETSCVAYNQTNRNGIKTFGLVNPKNANIRVYNFNPDLDVPSTCAGCPDTPCINACPITVNSETGEKALYLNKKTGAISLHEDKCIGCGNCARTCKSERTGVIRRNNKSGKPEGLCTYCDGDPSCVKNCPYGALSYVKVDTGYEFFGKSPTQIAKVLIDRYY